MDAYMVTLMGERGGRFLTSGDGQAVGDFYCIYPITEGVAITELQSNISNFSAISGRFLPAGILVPGVIATVTISGTGVALLVNKA